MYRCLFGLVALFAGLASFSQDPFHDRLVYQIPEMDKVKLVEGTVFKKVNDTSLKLDLYYPAGYTNKTLLPVVIFNNGAGIMDLYKWGQYTNWGKLIAANGMIAITHQARQSAPLADDESLIDYVVSHGNELGIDVKKIGLWTCSANTRAGARLAHKTRSDHIKTLVIYYGNTDSLGELKQNLPTLLVRAGLDNQFMNMGMEQFIQFALTQDIRLEVINFVNGVHAFDLFTNTDESRTIIKNTVSYLKENLNGPALSKDFVLTNRNFMWLMNNGMTERALSEFRKARTRYRSDSSFNTFFNSVIREDVLNANAYWLLQHQRQPQALETFKLMVETYPSSPNAYDGLADAYEVLGNRSDAVKASERVLELLPAARLDEQFKGRVRASAEDKIRRLKN